MDKLINTCMRTGRQIDIIKALEDLQLEYTSDLEASVQTYQSYEKVSEATYDDFLAVKKTLMMFDKLGYLYKDEVQDMIEAAQNERLNKLDQLIPLNGEA